MLTIGVTGGIGSGKSTVTDLFADKGVDVVDADVIAREIVALGSPTLDTIAIHFGKHILNENGTLNRPALRNIIFSNSSEKQWLESVTHPEIRRKTLSAIHASKGRYCIYSAPLLLESKQESIVDRVLVIDLPETLQIARATKRDNTSAEKISAIIESQLSRQKRLAKADDIIDNSGDYNATKAQVDKLHKLYESLCL